RGRHLHRRFGDGPRGARPDGRRLSGRAPPRALAGEPGTPYDWEHAAAPRRDAPTSSGRRNEPPMRAAALLIAAVACAPATTSQTPETRATPAAGADGARPGAPGAGALSTARSDPFGSTYAPAASRPTVIRNVNV